MINYLFDKIRRPNGKKMAKMDQILYIEGGFI